MGLKGGGSPVGHQGGWYRALERGGLRMCAVRELVRYHIRIWSRVRVLDLCIRDLIYMSLARDGIVMRAVGRTMAMRQVSLAAMRICAVSVSWVINWVWYIRRDSRDCQNSTLRHSSRVPVCMA